MDNFKDWYGNRKGKHILFFGFYLIFFIFFGIYIRSIKNNKPVEINEKAKEVEKITTYDITNLINNDYNYEIVVNDNEEKTIFKGSKTNVDYANYSNKYFLDIYNINQLIKRSKYIDTKENVLKYELKNSRINEILLTDKKEAINIIDVYVDSDTKVNRIVLDLTNFFDKEIYQIDIKYIVGDLNENSSS